VRLRNIAIAEQILSLVMDRGRAASTVGDLLEDSSTRDSRWFWPSIAMILFSRIWRPVVGFVGSAYATLYGMFAFSWGSRHYHATGQLVPLVGLLSVQTFIAAVYCVCCYGIKDDLTQVAGVLAGAGILGVWYGSLPGFEVSAAIVAVVFIAASVLSIERRRALFTLVVSLAASYAGWRLLVLLWEPRWDPQHTVRTILHADAMILLQTLTEVIVVSRVRQILLRHLATEQHVTHRS
jgi:hypothetical protein